VSVEQRSDKKEGKCHDISNCKNPL